MAPVHGTFGWTELMTRDPGPAATFYERLFGWTTEDQDTGGGPPCAIFDKEGRAAAGLGAMPPEMRERGQPSCWSSYVLVDDVDEIAVRVRDAGERVTVEPTEVMMAGRMAIIADPEGAALSLWQAQDHRGAEASGEPGFPSWNELAGRTLERLSRFYGELFGWSFADNPDSPSRYPIAKQGDREAGGLIQMTDEWGEMPAHWSVYFAVADADESAERVRSLGGKVHFGPFDTPVGRLAVCADDQDGHFSVLALTQA
jgi:hypothetical protein